MTDEKIFKLLKEACKERVLRFSDFERLEDHRIVFPWQFLIIGEHTTVDHILFEHRKVKRTVPARAVEIGENYRWRESVQQIRERYARCFHEPIVAVYRCTLGSVGNPYRAEHYTPGTSMHTKLTQQHA